MAALSFSGGAFVRDLYSWLFPTANILHYGVPLPPVSHQLLNSEHIGERPILIVGDIHGCLDEFQELVAVSKDKCGREDVFIACVGDLITKGPNPVGTLRYLRSLSAAGQLVSVRGNHEESVLREYLSSNTDSGYVLQTRFQYVEELTPEDYDYILRLPYSIRIPQINAVIVHAGLVPGVPLEDQLYKDITRMRNLVPSQSVLGPAWKAHAKDTAGVAWAPVWDGPEHVYFGHDAKRTVQDLPKATGLDSGCFYGN